MAKKISPESFQFILSCVSSMVQSCHAIAASEMDEGDVSLDDVNQAFGGKGKHLAKAAKDWLQLLGVASNTIVRDFYSDYDLKSSG